MDSFAARILISIMLIFLPISTLARRPGCSSSLVGRKCNSGFSWKRFLEEPGFLDEDETTELKDYLREYLMQELEKYLTEWDISDEFDDSTEETNADENKETNADENEETNADENEETNADENGKENEDRKWENCLFHGRKCRRGEEMVQDEDNGLQDEMKMREELRDLIIQKLEKEEGKNQNEKLVSPDEEVDALAEQIREDNQDDGNTAEFDEEEDNLDANEQLRELIQEDNEEIVDREEEMKTKREELEIVRILLEDLAKNTPE